MLRKPFVMNGLVETEAPWRWTLDGKNYSIVVRSLYPTAP